MKAYPERKHSAVLRAHLRLAGARVLDVGCGDGSLLAYLVTFKQVKGCGLELSQSGVNASVGYGLSAALRETVTLTGGVVDQSNFFDYELLRMEDMPRIEVHIVPSAEPPTGVGEPGTPVIAPAVANAVYRATGQRITMMPFSMTELRTA